MCCIVGVQNEMKAKTIQSVDNNAHCKPSVHDKCFAFHVVLPCFFRAVMARATEAKSIVALTGDDIDEVLNSIDQLSAAMFGDKIFRQGQEQQLIESSAAEKQAAEDLAATKKQADENPMCRFRCFIHDTAQQYAGVIAIAEMLKFADTIPAAELRDIRIDDIMTAVNNWPAVYQSALQTIKDVAPKDTEFLSSEGADIADISLLSSAVEETQSLFDKVSPRLIAERARRRDIDSNKAYFMENYQKIMQWCRQQMTTLHSLKEDPQIEEFCASFFNNIGVMESNFLVMISMADDVLPNDEVEKAIIEVNEIWIHLSTLAFEKLRTTVMEQHAASGLEQRCRAWPEFARRLKPFLLDAEKLLSLPSDEESVAVAAPLKESCRQLQADLEPHLLIVEHLGDFSLRHECLKDHYNAMRKTVFSKSTAKTLALQGQFAYARKQEYTDRLAELNDWVDCKTQSEAWVTLLARVEQMKKLIDETDLVQQAVSAHNAMQPLAKESGAKNTTTTSR